MRDRRHNEREDEDEKRNTSEKKQNNGYDASAHIREQQNVLPVEIVRVNPCERRKQNRRDGNDGDEHAHKNV